MINNNDFFGELPLYVLVEWEVGHLKSLSEYQSGLSSFQADDICTGRLGKIMLVLSTSFSPVVNLKKSSEIRTFHKFGQTLFRQ